MNTNDSQPMEPTYENYCSLENNERAQKVDAYIAGGLRGSYELDGWVYTIVRGTIIREAAHRLKIIYRN